MKAIDIKNITKRYGGRVAVDGLSFDIAQGELLALLGMNGAGKTTTLGILSGLVSPDGGDAFILGKSVVNDFASVKGLVSMSLQETAVAENLTVAENLLFICRVYGMKRDEARLAAEDVMRQFGLTDRQNDRAGKLSGGMKRRLSIAMALITKPRAVFLDEPTLGLDVVARRALWKIIESIKGGATIILTTHYLEEAEELADRIAVLKDGRLRGLGTARELEELTGTDTFEKAFLALAEED